MLCSRPVPAKALPSTSVIPKGGIAMGEAVKGLLEVAVMVGGLAGVYELAEHLAEDHL